MGREGDALSVRGKVAPVHPFVYRWHRGRGMADVQHSGGDNVLEGGPHGSPLQHLYKSEPVSLRGRRQLESENSSHLLQQSPETGILCRWVTSATMLRVSTGGGVEGCRYLPRLQAFCLTPGLPPVTLHRGCMGKLDSLRTRWRGELPVPDPKTRWPASRMALEHPDPPLERETPTSRPAMEMPAPGKRVPGSTAQAVQSRGVPETRPRGTPGEPSSP
nr:PREDICTED: uncharacterized protein LOC106703001 [Latimeria chalumnae]|eukprot:XP_014342346.1 PREDICTED: uncharacterized protein LOC106703001 [Latimeria chalumnae]